jgi:CMP/dCMP kinase
MIVAIDGPAGAGKSTVSKEVARNLGFTCLDTGAMYRAIAWQALHNGAALDDETALADVADRYHIGFVYDEGNPSPAGVTMGGVDVTTAIRTAEIDRAVSQVSKVPAVRRALVAQQQRIGNAGDFVVEGRDIGTVVFPDAALKVFLFASAEERARRRVAQNAERGVGSCDYEEVLADIVARDEADSSRADSPLAAAEDAVMLDSSDLTIQQVIDKICELAGERR